MSPGEDFSYEKLMEGVQVLDGGEHPVPAQGGDLYDVWMAGTRVIDPSRANQHGDGNRGHETAPAPGLSTDDYRRRYATQFNAALSNGTENPLPALTHLFPEDSLGQSEIVNKFRFRVEAMFPGGYEPWPGIIGNLNKRGFDTQQALTNIKGWTERFSNKAEVYEGLKELLGLLKALQEFMQRLIEADTLAHLKTDSRLDPAQRLERFAKQCAGEDMTQAINKLESIVSGVEAMAGPASGVPKSDSN